MRKDGSRLAWMVAAATLAAAAPARAGDFVDTRITLLFSDDNVLAAAGETTPNSPAARIGQATTGNTQFYDNFNTKYSGFETLSNLVLYKKTPAYFSGLSAEAALALNMLVARERPTSTLASVILADNSSYLRLNYTPVGWDPAKGEGFSFTGFPLSADRFRLGYAYKISWGGSNSFGPNAESVPGAKLQMTKTIAPDQIVYGFVGMKTTLLLNDEIHEQQTNYGVLAGAGVDLTPWLRWDASGGYFMKGVNPNTSVLGAPVRATGVSSQVVFHKGAPVGSSIDFALYRNDPDAPTRFFAPEQYPGGFSLTTSIEGAVLGQTLADPDSSGSTKVQKAYAGALQVRAKYNFLRLSMLGLWRSLTFTQFNIPSVTPFQNLPRETSVKDEKFIAIGADYHFPKVHMTPGIIGGVQMPASFSTHGTFGGNNPSVYLNGGRTVVVRDENLFQVLPQDHDPKLIWSLKSTLRWDLSETLAAVGEVYLNYDRNRTTFLQDTEGLAQDSMASTEATFQKPWILGFNTVLQARF